MPHNIAFSVTSRPNPLKNPCHEPVYSFAWLSGFVEFSGRLAQRKSLRLSRTDDYHRRRTKVDLPVGAGLSR
jgi:hypothetical protein